MFGYVIANLETLDEQEQGRYRSCYCGLCHTLGDRHGVLSRATLTYDMTFLILVLSSVYDSVLSFEKERCLLHPVKDTGYRFNEITEYAADMNILLAYHNFLDDWNDDRNVFSLSEAKLFERKAKYVEVSYPRQSVVIRDSISRLTALERIGETNPDIPGACMGRLMGEVFAYREDDLADTLRAFGHALGKFIYTMDAALDLKSDLKKKQYNPLVTIPSDSFQEILNVLMADCVGCYEKLPVEQDRHLIENILYSGVWTRSEIARRKTEKKADRKKTKRDT